MGYSDAHTRRKHSAGAAIVLIALGSNYVGAIKDA
jgi:hypothetical protein